MVLSIRQTLVRSNASVYKQGVIHFRSDIAETQWGAIFGFVAGALAMVIATIWSKPKPVSELRGLVWGHAERDPATVGKAPPWYKSPLLIFGVLVIIPGIVAGRATINKSAGINLGLWVGGLMLVIGAFFVIWILLKPPPPVTAAEMEAARKAREEFGTQGPPPGH